MAVEAITDIDVSKKSGTEVVESRKSAPLMAPFEEAERLFDRLMPRAWMPVSGWNWPLWGSFDDSLGNMRVPQMDVIDRDKELLIRLEIPGVEKQDVGISVSGSALHIKACADSELKAQKQDYVRNEISSCNFARNVPLPRGVDASKITAHLFNGILEVILPKDESVRRRSIEVK